MCVKHFDNYPAPKLALTRLVDCDLQSEYAMNMGYTAVEFRRFFTFLRDVFVRDLGYFYVRPFHSIVACTAAVFATERTFFLCRRQIGFTI